MLCFNFVSDNFLRYHFCLGFYFYFPCVGVGDNERWRELQVCLGWWDGYYKCIRSSHQEWRPSDYCLCKFLIRCTPPTKTASSHISLPVYLIRNIIMTKDFGFHKFKIIYAQQPCYYSVIARVILKSFSIKKIWFLKITVICGNVWHDVPHQPKMQYFTSTCPITSLGKSIMT